MNELEQAARQAYEHRRRDYGSVNENAIYFAATFARQQVEAERAKIADELENRLRSSANPSAANAQVRKYIVDSLRGAGK